MLFPRQGMKNKSHAKFSFFRVRFIIQLYFGICNCSLIMRLVNHRSSFSSLTTALILFLFESSSVHLLSILCNCKNNHTTQIPLYVLKKSPPFCSIDKASIAEILVLKQNFIVIRCSLHAFILQFVTN